MKFDSDALYVWVGGSCDYGHKERAGGGAYIAQVFDAPTKDCADAKTIDSFTCAEFDTTEFKMIFKAMNHALENFGSANLFNSESAAAPTIFSKIIFLSNVQYILNFEKPANVDIKILPYHKFEQQKEVHDMASEAMRELRKK